MDYAILSNDNGFTVFSYGGYVIRFFGKIYCCKRMG